MESAYESQKSEIASLLKLKKFDVVSSNLESRQEIIVIIIQTCESLIRDKSLEKKDKEEILGYVAELLEKHGPPIAVLINEYLYSLFMETYGEYSGEIYLIIDRALSLFTSDPERSSLKRLCCVFNLFLGDPDNKIFPEMAEANKSKFIDLWIKLKKLLSLIRNDNVTDKADMIAQILETSDLSQDKSFSNLEKIVILHYIEELNEWMQNKAFQDESGVNSMPIKEKKPEKVNHEEIKAHIGKQSLQERTFFYKNEIIKYDESSIYEYKNYFFPFNGIIRETLAKTICSFLNRRGGRIFIGITDDKKVVGINLNAKDRDYLRLDIQDIIKPFYPSIRNSELVHTFFLPIKDKEQQTIQDICIVKIIVKQGDRSKVYSTDNRAMKCFIRNSGQVAYLECDELTKLIIDRSNNPTEQEIPKKEFEDPDPDPLEDSSLDFELLKMIKMKSDDSKYSMNGSQGLKNKGNDFSYQKDEYVVQVEIPVGIDRKLCSQILELEKYGNPEFTMQTDNYNLSIGKCFVKFKLRDASSTFAIETNVKNWKNHKFQSKLLH